MSKRKHPFFSEKTILKIPKSDFPSLGQSQSTTSTGHTSTDSSIVSSSPAPASPLLLLQLPPGFTVNDLAKSHFAFDQNDEMNKCRLISEEKGVTLDLVKVSTSNSYVLVPGSKQEGTGDGSKETRTNPTVQNKNDSNGPFACVEARLLRETDTFFLECTESKIDLVTEIDKILQEFVYPTPGISIDEISQRLMCSKKEVKIALDKMQAFQVFCGDGGSQPTYGLLSEEVEIQVWYVIRSVLSEWDGGRDYAGQGVLLQDMIEEIMRRNDGSEDDLEEGVVRNCLNKCIVDIDNGRVRLDANYIARIVAHHVFNLQTDPWERENFIKQWYKLMPGVGPMYEPQLTSLRGIAIETSHVSPLVTNAPLAISDQKKGEMPTYLKYFRRECLPSSHNGRFKALFKEKSMWKFDELMPYIEDLLDKSKFKTSKELLLHYAKIAPKEEGGDEDDNIDWYMAK